MDSGETLPDLLCLVRLCANKCRMAIALLWNASPLWGLLASRALSGLGVPFALLKAQEIQQGGLSDKRLLIVPGGSARQKLAELGPKGADAIRRFVAEGGAYLGFCGGAGLGLTGEDGLGLCPWRRARMQDRRQHLFSGHVRARLSKISTLPDASYIVDKSGFASLPVWWPGRFAPIPDTSTGIPVDVLATYEPCAADALLLGDLSLRHLPANVAVAWQELGIELPSALAGMPCLVRGRYGRGNYILSYSHLETPESPQANALFRHLLREYGDTEAITEVVPPWHTDKAPLWDEPHLRACRRNLDALLRLGHEHGLLFPRNSWLTGWRPGVPGSGLNALNMALHVLESTPPSPQTQQIWHGMARHFAETFQEFRKQAEICLLTQRLCATLASTDAELRLCGCLRDQRTELFGTAMQGGGLYQELMNALDPLLFLTLHQQAVRPEPPGQQAHATLPPEPQVQSARQESPQDSALVSRPLLFFSGGTALRDVAGQLAAENEYSVHVVTSFDSGGSSAALRETFVMPAVGDIRSRVLALSPDSVLLSHRLSTDLVEAKAEFAALLTGDHPLLMQEARRREWQTLLAMLPHETAFTNFDFCGASVGNLVLTALYLRHGRRLAVASHEFGRLTGARGLVRAVSDVPAHLLARLADGREIVGQHRFASKAAPLGLGSPIIALRLVDAHGHDTPVEAAPAAIRHIGEAGLLCYPVGSFFSSVLACLLPHGIARAVAAAHCPKVYLPNPGFDPELEGVPLGKQLTLLRRALPENGLTHLLLAPTTALDSVPADVLAGLTVLRHPILNSNGRLNPAATVRALCALRNPA